MLYLCKKYPCSFSVSRNKCVELDVIFERSAYFGFEKKQMHFVFLGFLRYKFVEFMMWICEIIVRTIGIQKKFFFCNRQWLAWSLLVSTVTSILYLGLVYWSYFPSSQTTENTNWRKGKENTFDCRRPYFKFDCVIPIFHCSRGYPIENSCSFLK